ncbi:hypothetical protein ACFU9F_30965 [Streptomyces zhihengii]|uniref:hypothetical protein n=1 Tax=Streptomyces zhihengii TaxID=1818004 RepID=UPI0036A667B3
MDHSDIDWAAPSLDPNVVREVRGALRDLAEAASEGEAIDATHALHESICYAAVTVEAETVPAVGALRRLLADRGFVWPQFALQLLETVASVDGVLASATALKGAVREELLRVLPWAEEASTRADRDVRGAAVLFLATMSQDGAEDFRRFRTLAGEETDDVAQADLALAAVMCAVRADGRVPDGFVRTCLTHGNPAVRYRVGLFLDDHGYQYPDGDLRALTEAAGADVLSRGLYRMEYM